MRIHTFFPSKIWRKIMHKKRILTLITMFLGLFLINGTVVHGQELSNSLQYVENMGTGWNLGNTFDGFDEEGDQGEESWGNPKVTKELIQTIKNKGFDSIRIPFTAHMRISGSDDNFTIDEDYLSRYEEVVNWALEEDLYVMVNLHHDSWIWLADWDGDETSEEFIKYARIWEQLADRFKAYDERVMFESINEPQFYGVDDATAIHYISTINQKFYDIVRNIGGNNTNRMLVLPTLLTDTAQDKLDALSDQINNLNDENIIATVHYYSEWVYSANLGKTRFDEILWDNDTSRTSLIDVFDRLYNTFNKIGIGVTIGEYGLLGYDKSDTANQLGETLKFIDFINYYAREKNINLMLWDNGQHLNRTSYQWNNALFGGMIETSMRTRSSYSTGLDTNFLTAEDLDQGLTIPLTLNGNTLINITNEADSVLVVGDHYSITDNEIQLSADYLQDIFEKEQEQIGETRTLVFHFSNGESWQQNLIYVDKPKLTETSGNIGDVIKIPTEFNGQQLEKVTSKNKNGEIVSNNSWWDYLEIASEFSPNYEEQTIDLLSNYTRLLSDDTYKLTFTFYSGDSFVYELEVTDGRVAGSAVTEAINTDKDDDESKDDKKDPDKEDENDDEGNDNGENAGSEEGTGGDKTIEDEIDGDIPDAEDKLDDKDKSGGIEKVKEKGTEENPNLKDVESKDTEDDKELPKTGQENHPLYILVGIILVGFGLIVQKVNQSKKYNR